MALRKIVLEGDEILRKKSRPVTEFDKKLWDLLDDMRQTMGHYQGVGLAAVQVGMLRRVITIDVGDGLMELVNPEILRATGSVNDSEGCLSSPEEYGMVERPERVEIKAQNRHGEWYTATGTGLLARAFCHEIDHLDGILFKDLATEMLEQVEEPKKKKLKVRVKDNAK